MILTRTSLSQGLDLLLSKSCADLVTKYLLKIEIARIIMNLVNKAEEGLQVSVWIIKTKGDIVRITIGEGPARDSPRRNHSL